MIVNWTKLLLSENPYERKKSTYEILKITELLKEKIAKQEFINLISLFIYEEDEIVGKSFINEFTHILNIAKQQKFIPKYIPILEKLCYTDCEYVKNKTIEYGINIKLEDDFENKEQQFLSLIKKLSISNNQNSKFCGTILSLNLFECFIKSFGIRKKKGHNDIN